MSSYWENRFLQIDIDRIEADDDYIKKLEQNYVEFEKTMRQQIESFVKRYADDNVISETEARQLLSKPERKKWKMTLDEYRRKAIEGGYQAELDNEYFRSRISRLEQFKAQLYFDLAEEANKQDAKLSEYLSEQYEDTYLKNVYEITDKGTLVTSFDMPNKSAIDTAIRSRWASGNFSSRVWSNYTKIIPRKLDKVMSLSFSNGWSIDKTLSEMMRGIDKSLVNRMTTLVQTESAHIADKASFEAYKELDVEEYQWLATLEKSTCELCGELDGKVWEVDDKNGFRPVVNSHPNCRCTTVPVVPGFKLGKRWSRDPETGKGKVVDNMSFKEWKKQQVKN